jgi:hypothetical protein
LIPAIAAAVVVVVAAVVLLITNLRSEDTRAATTVTPVVTTSVTDQPATSPASGDAPVQRCPNGTTVPAADTCPTDLPVTCWDNGSAPSAELCPALEGRQALEWVFPAGDGWTRTCVPYEKEKYAGELEVYQCSVEELPKTTIFLSRWDDPASASAQFTANGGAPLDFRLEGDGDAASAVEWTQRVDLTNDDGTTEQVIERSIAYKTVPYSVLVYFADPDGVGAQSEQAWIDGALFQAPETIDGRGTA